jgi:hypothetical protein
MELTDHERMAINEFLGEHWADFMEVAGRYLEDQEIDDLAEKLGHSQ